VSIGTLTIMRKEIKYGILIGRIDNEYYFLDYLFFETKKFKGATGSVMSPMDEDEYNERVESYFDPENMREFWKGAIEDGQTEDGLDDWIEFVRNTDGEEGVIDRSHSSSYGEELKEKLGEEKAFEIECVGGGRCFKEDMQWDEIYDKELWEKIKEYEK